MKIIGGLVLLVGLASPLQAWDTSKNPDGMPSIGWGINAGKLPGFASRYSQFTEFAADGRVPVTNYFTLNMTVADTTLQNAPTGVGTDSYRVGVNVRVYLHDLK